MKKKEFEYLKDQVKEYLHFSSSERNGILILLILIVFFIFLPRIYLTIRQSDKTWDPSEFIRDIEQADKEIVFPEEQATEMEKPCRAFDPNLANEDLLLETGLRPGVVKTIINYRNKGGKFRHKSDLKKIYGLKDDEFFRIESCIKISSLPSKEKEKYSNNFKKREYKKNDNSGPNRESENELNPEDSSSVEEKAGQKKEFYWKPAVIEINEASIEEWQALYGIGPVLSARIVKFRESLGGFISISQVSEVFGLPDSTFLSIQPNLMLIDPVVQKIRINHVSAEELKSHPYFTWKQANAMIKYRENHGPFKGREDLIKLHILKNSDLDKIAPYMDFAE